MSENGPLVGRLRSPPAHTPPTRSTTGDLERKDPQNCLDGIAGASGEFISCVPTPRLSGSAAGSPSVAILSNCYVFGRRRHTGPRGI